MVPAPIPFHDLVAIIHHLVVDSLAIVANTILLAAISTRSPPTLKSYKLIMMCCTLLDFTTAVSQLSVMSRVVPATPVIVHFYVGPCTIISGRLCHILDTVLLTAASQTLILIVVSFGYRFFVISRDPPRSTKTLMFCAASFIPNLLLLIIFSTSQDDSKLVKDAIRKLRPAYSVDSYVVEGYLDIFSPVVLLLISTVCGPILPTFMFIVTLRRRFLRSIALHSASMSNRTRSMHETLTKVLYLQSALPLCYFGPAVFLFLCIFSDDYCSVATEHAVLAAASYMALVAPLISLYYVKPYRLFVRSLVSCCANDTEEATKSTTTVQFTQTSRHTQ